MKIGIITWFNNLNFGTALQAVALQDYLKRNFNADVSLLNYTPDSRNQLHSRKQKLEHLPYKLIKKAKEAVHNEYEAYDRLMNTQYKKELDDKVGNFTEFMKGICFTDKISEYSDFQALNEVFDLFICGSDQIWNPQLLDKSYFLEFASKPKLAYAVSFGVEYIPNYAKERIKEYTKDFRAIGLRESACEQSLKELTATPVATVCDPTLLFDGDYWSENCDNECVPKEKYFVTYFLGDTRFGRNAIKTVSQRLKIKNVILPSTDYTLGICDNEAISYGPAQFTALIKNAEFVLTDSFHATCFSIIFNKKFCTIKKHSGFNPFNQNSRITALLATAGIPDRLAQSSEDIVACLENEINYDDVNIKINDFRKSSKEFLSENIK